MTEAEKQQKTRCTLVLLYLALSRLQSLVSQLESSLYVAQWHHFLYTGLEIRILLIMPWVDKKGKSKND